jgi:hypothetical protein
MEVIGKIIHVYPTEAKSEKFRVQEFVLNIPGKYEQTVLFQCSNDRCGIPDKFLNQNVTVHFDLQGRKWSDPKSGKAKVFNTLSCWKIEGAEVAAPPAAAAPTAPPPPQEAHIPSPHDDEFPF